MDKILINGGKPLCGEVHISGAKNAAVAIIPAALLVSGKCTIENVPDISDVDSILRMIKSLGADVEKIDRNTVVIDAQSDGCYMENLTITGNLINADSLASVASLADGSVDLHVFVDKYKILGWPKKFI